MPHTFPAHDILDHLDPAEFQALTPAAAARLAALLSAGDLNRTPATLELLLTVFPETTATGTALTALFGGGNRG